MIVKILGGYFYVHDGARVRPCVVRGRVKARERLLVGDRVLLSALPDGKGVVEEVRPRVNSLGRPPVANVDQAVLVFSFAQPPPDLFLLDRLLVLAAYAGVTPLVVASKADLAANAAAHTWPAIYRRAGYEVLVTSTVTGAGLEALAAALAGRISVLAGPSGSGKSSLLNALAPQLLRKTGDISRRLGRGRHTTREVTLLPLSGSGWVADTPGFSVLELPPLEERELAGYFPEIAALSERCRFTGCLHYREQGCAVKQGVAGGLVAPSRYEHYKSFLKEILARERKSPD
ncbi:MAG: ribosome small subunit-dependent GTPase A [Bacillota bacterium]